MIESETRATPYFESDLVRLYRTDARSIPLPEDSVHCIVTSPPFYGLRQYDGADDGALGLEPTPDAYIDSLVEVMDECRRVLRPDGIMWLNLADSYSGSGKGQNGDGSRNPFVGPKQATYKGTLTGGLPVNRQSPKGNQMGIPWRVALELQLRGWTVRDTVIWEKLSPKPESIHGTRWERCRVKIARGAVARHGLARGEGYVNQSNLGARNPITAAKWKDCPGCSKCGPTGGYVLVQGSWRSTASHEYLLMLTLGMGYYGDGETVRRLSGGNRRSVWDDIAPERYRGDHHAVFPTGLPRLCIQASTSEAGVCPACGAQWARVVERPEPGDSTRATVSNGWGRIQRDKNPFVTIGWRPTCRCGGGRPVPALVLDPFVGVGTTCLAAERLRRHSVGIDLSGGYLDQAVGRLSGSILELPLT